MCILINIDSENETYAKRLATKIKCDLESKTTNSIDIHEIITEDEYEEILSSNDFETDMLDKHDDNIDKVKELSKKRQVIINRWTTNSLLIHEGCIESRQIFRMIKRRLCITDKPYDLEINIFIYSNQNKKVYIPRGENVIRNPYQSIRKIGEFIKEHCEANEIQNKITILINSDLIDKEFQIVSDERISNITKFIHELFDLYMYLSKERKYSYKSLYTKQKNFAVQYAVNTSGLHLLNIGRNTIHTNITKY